MKILLKFCVILCILTGLIAFSFNFDGLASENSTDVDFKTPLKFPSRSTERVVFKPLLNLLPDGEVKLANGDRVDPALWQAVIVSTFKISDDSVRHCTATIIGPNVILTAAHCVDNGRAISMPAFVEIDGVPIALYCTMHPSWVAAGVGYNIKNDADYALCKSSTIFSGVSYENIEYTKPLTIDTLITLVGYGCTDISLDDDNKLVFKDSKGILRVGEDKVYDISFPSQRFEENGTMITTMSPKNTEPTLCPGDSGGPALRSIGNGKRSIVAVNSAVNWIGIGHEADFYSIFAPLSSDIFVSFLDEWSDFNRSVKICGYNLDRGTRGCKS
jgi:hypothetical protein